MGIVDYEGNLKGFVVGIFNECMSCSYEWESVVAVTLLARIYIRGSTSRIKSHFQDLVLGIRE